LVLRVSEPSPVELAKTVLQGDKPAIRIEGDVQLAAEVNWLIDHVRWQPEEDLARVIGDAPAHTLVQTARRAVDALKAFVKQNQNKAGT
jgi:ubiquinone biosynthesis protein UbiJ